MHGPIMYHMASHTDESHALTAKYEQAEGIGCKQQKNDRARRSCRQGKHVSNHLMVEGSTACGAKHANLNGGVVQLHEPGQR